MINATINNTPVRNIKARVELYNGSTLARTFNSYDALKSIKLERVGESKFFGFGYCQKVNIHLRDTRSELEITTANSMKIYFNDIDNFPQFFVSEVHRDENTGELSITAYDAIYNKYTFSDLGLEGSYSIQDIVDAIAALLNMREIGILVNDTAVFNTEYPDGANFDGTETIREVLNAIAEATQTIYYIQNRALMFKRLDVSGEAVYTIDKELYMNLDSGTNRRLASIVSVTELGDNVSTSATYSGTTQYIRNNPFWDLREDIGTLVDNALAAVGGLTINQFTCSWRGNYLLELGDKIDIVAKDNSKVTTYFLNDTITYDGAYSQKTQWSYEDTEETESNPSTLGEQLKQTYARVDKANKQVQLVVNDVQANKEAIAESNITISTLETNISELAVNSNGIAASVESLSKTITDSTDAINEDIVELNKRVEAQITAEDVKLEIEAELANGASKVTTTTGFTFNDEGLTIEKSGSEMKTTITEDGMTVYKDNSAVLTANNVGVEAVNLHATTYLIIGTNSRFEDYGSGRTGCFWIGE